MDFKSDLTSNSPTPNYKCADLLLLGGTAANIVKSKSTIIHEYIDLLLKSNDKEILIIEVLKSAGDTFIKHLCIYHLLQVLTHTKT